MKQNDGSHNIHTSPINGIPDIEIVDLENETMQETNSGKSAHKANRKQTYDVSPMAEEYEDFSEEYEEEYYPEEDVIPAPAGIRRFLNVHVFFALVMIVVIGLVAYRFTHWGQRVSQSDIFKDGQGSYDDSWDSILPLTDEKGQMVITDASNIVLFGNAPFADDRDSSDGLANLIAKETGATVYNCSISGSYLAAQERDFDPTVAAMDAYCLYWMVCLATGAPIDNYYVQAAEQLGDKTPADAEIGRAHV